MDMAQSAPMEREYGSANSPASSLFSLQTSGTKMSYSRNQLLNLANSPLSASASPHMKHSIPPFLRSTQMNQSEEFSKSPIIQVRAPSPEKSTAHVQHSDDKDEKEEQFEMEL